MGRPARILALDDSLTMRKLMEVVFKPPTFALTLTATGAEAIAAGVRVQPDLIIIDYVLPDMKGVEICEAFSKDERTKSTPVLVTSAKGAKILESFAHLTTVVGFVPKPFKPDEIRNAALRALQSTEKSRADAARAPRAEPARAPRADAAAAPISDKERLARALFAVLQPSLLRIPEWLREAGSESVDRFLARKLLTAKTLDGVLEAAHASPPLATAPVRHESSSSLSGSTSLVSLDTLLGWCASARETGVLTFSSDACQAWLWLREGRVVCASSNDCASYSAPLNDALADVPAAVRRSAEDAQKKSGVPLVVALAECGALPLDTLARQLARGTRETLLQLGAGEWHFEWTRASLPSFADAHGRAVVLDDVKLERLRRAPRASPANTFPLTTVLRRCVGFSDRTRGIEFTPEERKLLTLVNQRNRLDEILGRCDLSEKEACACLERLHELGLIAVAERSIARESEAGSHRAGRVAVLEPDGTATASMLMRRMAARRKRCEVVSLTRRDELEAHFDSALDALIVAGSSSQPVSPEIAEFVRRSLEFADLKLVAVLETEQAEQASQLLSAGFDRVLVKPFVVGELEQSISAL